MRSGINKPFRTAVLAWFCAGASLLQAGTFELSDPAAEIMQEREEAQKSGEAPRSGADPVPGGERFEGIGGTKCGEHLSASEESSGQYALNLYWLQGFIDGVGYQRGITLGDDRLSPDYEPESMWSWIAGYCVKNPAASLTDAAWEFVRESS